MSDKFETRPAAKGACLVWVSVTCKASMQGRPSDRSRTESATGPQDRRRQQTAPAMPKVGRQDARLAADADVLRERRQFEMVLRSTTALSCALTSNSTSSDSHI